MCCKNLTMCRLTLTRVFHVVALFLLIFRCIGTVRIRHNGGRQVALRFHGHGNGDGSAGLWPNVFNVATKASISTNATCGERGREEFCRLVEHGRGRCGICDANSPDQNKRHPIENAIDGTTRWWQSPTLFTGSHYETVTITLDLKQVYQVVYVIIKAGNSPRPGSWVLERSVDGDTYSAWQYYVISDDECAEVHGLPATPGKPRYVTDTDVICTAYYSKLYPLENGEIHTSLLNGRPGANETSPELLEFTRARYVRLRLLKHRVSSGDLGPRWLSGWHQGSLVKKMYYSIRDIFIGGQCVCSGHANSCRHNVASGGPECECQHHTCGTNCDRCCPLYNQRQWGPGTSRDGHPCEPCQCYGHASECIYDEEIAATEQSLDTYGRRRGGGVCINCTDFTSGINCEKCLEGYFRPKGVPPDANVPCVPCDCDLDGSEGTCLQEPEDQAGRCVCRSGYAGDRCNHCAPGYRGYPRCEQCPCDTRGTILRDDCEGVCKCKANVRGTRCDICKEGHFALRTENFDGCIPCYCSEITNVCESAYLSLQMIETLDDWLVCDITAKETIRPGLDMDTNWLSVGNYEFPGIEAYYWLVPEAYTGNKLESYASEIIFNVNWVVMRGDTSGKPTTGPNIILVGANGLRIAHGDATFAETNNATIQVTLHEHNWYHVPLGVKDIVTRLRRTEYRGDPVTRSQFMSILTNVKHILLRAKFHTDQIEGSLQQATLSLAGNPDAVEKCACPTGYTGLSCESCDYGYVRVMTNTSIHTEQGVCIKCNCNGHSANCNADTTECDCEHNTIGLMCERCAVGYYGNPLSGTPDDCKRCACPMLEDENNFSPSCQLDELDPDVTSDAYVCTQCPQGYTGDHCEICDYGYFGSPTTSGSRCELCSCNGNPCDRTTGQCLSCRGNTEGWRCERCKAHHYGDPVSANCQPCLCDPIGALGPDCDPLTGQCECKERFVGRICDRCEAGYGNVTADCPACSCHSVGATSNICDPLNGICTCKPGVEGFRCDACQHLHFGFSDSGCLGCACNPAGSEITSCDIVTGQCRCKPNVIGLNCDSCEDGYWGLESGNGCYRCECDEIGSINRLCDQKTQQCLCKAGIGGIKCDTCLPGYFGYSNTGCQKCEFCDKPGHICDPDTGRCVCPANSRGESCERCVPNSYGREIGKGCKACNCALHGSIKKQCDLFTGQCECKTGYMGQRCDKCSFGYYGYPRCRRCDCDRAGTEPEKCDINGLCACDDSGQCLCKTFVIGKQCNHCSNGTFGLHADNPGGCTQCFCFGRTAHCTESKLTIGHVRLNTSRELNIEYTYRKKIPPIQKHFYNKHFTLENDMIVIPGVYDERIHLDADSFIDRAIYWRLPNEFLGDRILSYGGYLRFMTETIEGANLLSYNSYPLVQIKGNDKLILEHYQLVPSKNNKYEIRFHESLWRRKDEPKGSITRDVLMVALQKLQHILIRANDAVNFNKVVLHNVTLDTAIMLPGSPPPLAKGVELCECPRQYNSSSCQNPSIGYYRYYNPSRIDGTIVIDLIGEARKCECNGRSDVCDTETGHCLNCSENTTGSNCQNCSEGYYGNPMEGKCNPCPCPTHERNFAKHCHRLHHGGFKCICKAGYSGAKCDKCKLGYYGNPEQEGGMCTPCNCNKYGSASYECDEETGQCNCKPGIMGKDCSLCENHRFVLEVNGCEVCDNCTQWLLNDLDKMVTDLDKLYQEYILYDRARQLYDSLNEMSNRNIVLNQELQDYISLQDSIQLLSLDPVNQLYDTYLNMKNSPILETSQQIQQDLENMKNDIKKLRKNVREKFKQIEKTINDLNKFGKDHIKLKHAVTEGSKMLQEINSISIDNPEFNEVYNYCSNILDNIEEKQTNHSAQLDTLQFYYNDFEKRLKDMKNYVKKLFADVESGDVKNTELDQRIHILREKINGLKDVTYNSEQEEINVRNAQKLLISAKTNIEQLKNSEKFKDLLSKAEDKNEELKKYSLDELKKQVFYAKKHADVLSRLAKEYRKSFNISHETDLALKASKAYQDIIDYLNEARNIAENAETIMNDANKKIHPDENVSLLKETGNSVKLSEKLKRDSNQLLTKVDYLDDLRENLNISITDTQHILWRTALSDNQLNINLRNITSDKKDMLSIIHSANAISSKMHEIYKNASYIKDEIKHKLRPELNRLQKAGIEIVSLGEEKLSVAERNVKNSLDILISLETNNYVRRSNNTKLNDTISFKIDELKRRILKVKQAAYGIRIPLGNKLNSLCTRSYKPSNYDPTTTTEIIVTISIDQFDKKSSILYFPTVFNTFMALELVDDTIQFLWNLGYDTGQVNIPLPGTKEEKSVYKIEIERIANVVKMSVQYYGKDEEKQITKSNSTNPDFTRFHASPTDLIWVGGKLVNDIEDTGIPGCLQDVVFNGKSIGLWNYISSYGCYNCNVSRIGSGHSSDCNFFNGNGYLVKTSEHIHKQKATSIDFNFRTYDEDALLFLAVDISNNRFVSIVLKNGKVQFHIEYGGNSVLILTTSEKYNTGNKTKVSAGRVFQRKREEGQLSVNEETQRGTPMKMPEYNSFPNLEQATFYYGGVPPGFQVETNGTTKALHTHTSLLGDIANMYVDAKVDLNIGKRYGVEPACNNKLQNLRIAGFHGSGFIELPEQTLNVNTVLGFVFQTIQKNAFILASFGKDKTDSFYAVAIEQAKLILTVQIGNKKIVLSSNITVNDGRYHVVTIKTKRRKIDLRIDDRLYDQKEMDLRNKNIQGNIYFGGLSNEVNTSDVFTEQNKLIGSIKDVIFNSQIMPFGKFINFDQVTIGRPGPQPINDEMDTLTQRPITTISPLQCHRITSYSVEPGAVKFGDSINSYVQHNLKNNFWDKDYSIELEFRTFYKNGLIFVSTGLKGRNRHLILLTLKNHVIYLIVKTKKEITLQRKFDERNEWHQITIRKIRKKLYLSVDGNTVASKVPKKLNANKNVFIGGVPVNDTIIPLTFMNNQHPFRGCIRNLKVNNESQDLIRDNNHGNVGQCFQKVEKGSYFAGDAYAVYKYSFVVHIQFEFEFEFRTWEQNGILLSITDPSTEYGLSLELYNGAVVMIENMGINGPSKVETNLSTEYSLCDNKWHKVSALYSKEEMTVNVDGVVRSSLAINTPFMENIIESALYIGGLPDDAPLGTLHVRENFKGCIRNVKIGRIIVDWTDMDDLQNILLNSCPITD